MAKWLLSADSAVRVALAAVHFAAPAAGLVSVTVQPVSATADFASAAAEAVRLETEADCVVCFGLPERYLAAG